MKRGADGGVIEEHIKYMGSWWQGADALLVLTV